MHYFSLGSWEYSDQDLRSKREFNHHPGWRKTVGVTERSNNIDHAHVNNFRCFLVNYSLDERLGRQRREVHPRHLVTCMALYEAGKRHHDNAGGSRKLSAVAVGHTMHVKEKHYEKVGEDFE